MLAILCGWLQREQESVIAFLREENRVLKAQLAGRRLRLDDSERRRLAELGYHLGRRLLADVATIGMSGPLARAWDITGWAWAVSPPQGIRLQVEKLSRGARTPTCLRAEAPLRAWKGKTGSNDGV